MRSRLLSGSILYSIHGLGIRLGSANPKECFRSGGSNANNQWHGFFKLLKKGPQMPFQPFHPLKKDVSKLSRRKSKRVREDLILSSFDSEFANFKSSWKNFTLSELQAATDDFNHGTKVEEILRQSTDVEEVDRRVQEYEQASRRYEAAGWIRKMVKVVAGCGESY
ncbi:uncharacterized protein [Arachis hypogaea]|uniref:uncharacterized protein isoform X4 n=1 Tax=Arachis hypogaea TaxID=3818 RepID=UPI003B2248B2